MRLLVLIVPVLLFSACMQQESKLDPGSADFSEKARAIHEKSLVIDTHIDIPLRILRRGVDVGQRLPDGHFDLIRAKEGGLDAAFWAVYVASDYNKPGTWEGAKGGAYARANLIIATIDSVVRANSDLAALARTPEDVRRIVAEGKHAVCMGMENGAPVEGDLNKLRDLFDKGIRYITLTHAKDNHICDSSYDTRHTHKGLTAFGREMVQEMNRLGMMIDISHVSDDAFWQVLELSRAPLIASHSSLRKYHDMERNMSDSMMVALAQHGGVMQYNFGSYFVSGEWAKAMDAWREQYGTEFSALQKQYEHDPAARRQAEKEFLAKHPAPTVSIDDVVEQIDYAIKLMGIDHVGLGSDYDGVGAVPVGLDDVSTYPALTEKLLARGYTEADIRKLNGENLLRVWQACIDTAAEMAAAE